MNDVTAQEPARESFVDVLARATRPPRAVPVLVALNVAVFGAMALAGAGVVSPHPAVHVRWGSNFGPLTADGECWRLEPKYLGQSFFRRRPIAPGSGARRATPPRRPG